MKSMLVDLMNISYYRQGPIPLDTFVHLNSMQLLFLPSTGFFGTDCCLSLDNAGKPELLAGQGYQPREKAPKIYVYELPPSLNNIW